jgi:hypothetical protein
MSSLFAWKLADLFCDKSDGTFSIFQSHRNQSVILRSTLAWLSVREAIPSVLPGRAPKSRSRLQLLPDLVGVGRHNLDVTHDDFVGNHRHCCLRCLIAGSTLRPRN